MRQKSAGEQTVSADKRYRRNGPTRHPRNGLSRATAAESGAQAVERRRR